MATESTVTIDRDYIDSFSVKEYCEETLIPKYFPDIDPSLRTVGMLGYVTELITNYGEDTFNTGSVLFRETFPNRAQVQESIYSHAAIFQLDYVLTTPATCKFLLVLEEAAIVENMINNYDKDSGIYHFYIDKNTTINIEGIPFTLDYDIQMNIVKKSSVSGDDYIFTAQYIFDEYTNCLSDLKDPYIKVRRSTDGFMALEVQTHQCIRDIIEEQIIDNNTINYPALDITYDSTLAGFEVLYKAPGDTDYTQLKKLLVYSTPLKTPFCYYQIIKTGQLRITFNSKDTYFMPEFDSNLKIILYYTRGEEGNFESYTGTNIEVVPDNSVYGYSNLYLTAAKPIGSSENGLDQNGIDTLQALTVEGYRTALALTTENDLQEYFDDYKYRYGNSDILFIKKRDDVYERVYSAFLIIKNDDYIYNTNTLNLKLNLSDMTEVEKDTYVIEPGWLFTANDTSGYAEFFRDADKYEQYYADYLLAVKNGEIPYIEETSSEIPPYLDRAASYAEYKKRHNLEDRISVFDIDTATLNANDIPIESKFLFINPFMIRFVKQPNLVSTYMTYVMNTSVLDFVDENDDSFVQFITYTLDVNRDFSKKKVYDISLNVATSIQLSDQYPIIQKDEDGNYILGDKYNVVNNDLRIVMLIKDGNKNVCFTELYPTEFNETASTFKFEGKVYTDDHLTSDGRLRLLDGKIYRNDTDGSYYKVHSDDATLYNKYDKNDVLLTEDVPVDTVTQLYKKGELTIWYNVHNMTVDDSILIPLSTVTCEIYTLYNRYYDEESKTLVKADSRYTNNIFYPYDSRYDKYFWTNKYSTASEPVTFIQPLDSVRTYLTFEDYTVTEGEGEEKKYVHDIMDVVMKSLSFLRAKTILDSDKISYFMSTFFNNYQFITNIIDTRLRNCTNLDTKFYNTYGRSRDFVIGESTEKLDTVNLQIEFDMWFINGTDLLTAVPAVKAFIKENIEVINEGGTNNLYISNLMRKIENNFAYVDHIRFVRINEYSSTYQTVKSEVEDINNLSVEDRRFYVPELLVCETDDIVINEYFVQ